MNDTTKFIELKPDSLFVFPKIPLPYPAGEVEIQELPLAESCVDIHLTVGEVARLFDQHPDWPGVILTANGQFLGLLTRRACAEFLGSFLGMGIFSKVSIFAFFAERTACGLVLDGHTHVQQAATAALNRQDDSIEDPIVVQLDECRYGLLDAQVLLQAHYGLLNRRWSSSSRRASPRDPLTGLPNRCGF